jgi:KAP family P-loop domain
MADARAGRPQPHGSKAARDALGHDGVAAAIAGHVTRLAAGSVIAVHGPWGRGKTDVVSRVFELFEQDPAAPEPLWIDPWQYGRPDLIQPLVLALLSRMRDQEPKDRDRLRKAAVTLLHAGNAMMFKAVSVLVPFGAIAGAAQPAVDTLIDRALAGGDSPQPDADADPVHTMALRFYELVDEVLAQPSPEGTPGRDAARRPTKPLLICIDDLDRCLPDHQIAMLEAIHFLTSAGANCSFLVALDPVLVRQAAITHYQTDGFDSNQYLDKLFHLRVNLTALAPGRIGMLVDAELAGPASRDGAQTGAELLLAGLAAEPAAVKTAFETVF